MNIQAQQHDNNEPFTAATQTLTPNVDVFENAEEYLFLADLPGVTQQNLKLSLESDTLAILGTRDGVEYRRSFALPTTVDAEQAKAELKSGVLTLHLPKSKASRTRQISVKAG